MWQSVFASLPVHHKEYLKHEKVAFIKQKGFVTGQLATILEVCVQQYANGPTWGMHI